jgi:death-on-curing protein
MADFKIIPTSSSIVRINQDVCLEGGNPHKCYDIGKIESAIHSAFYPGSYPYEQGGAARVAGALCYYLLKTHAFMDGNKRTAVLTAVTFLDDMGWELRFPIDEEKGLDALAEVVDDAASGKVSKEELMEWFDRHKVLLT